MMVALKKHFYKDDLPAFLERTTSIKDKAANIQMALTISDTPSG